MRRSHQPFLTPLSKFFGSALLYLAKADTRRTARPIANAGALVPLKCSHYLSLHSMSRVCRRKSDSLEIDKNAENVKTVDVCVPSPLRSFFVNPRVCSMARIGNSTMGCTATRRRLSRVSRKGGILPFYDVNSLFD